MHFDDTFRFELQSPDGNAIITCADLPLDIRHEIAATVRTKKEEIQPELVERYQAAMCAAVVKVEGLSDGQGEVTAERVRAKRISPRLLDIISAAYWAASAAAAQVDQKKTTSAAA